MVLSQRLLQHERGTHKANHHQLKSSTLGPFLPYQKYTNVMNVKTFFLKEKMIFDKFTYSDLR